LETSQRNSAWTRPMISRWVVDDAYVTAGQPSGSFERRALGLARDPLALRQLAPIPHRRIMRAGV
jgi:hypothetical protein